MSIYDKTILKILIDKVYLDKFLDYENNKDFFFLLNLDSYLSTMDKWFKYFHERNIDIPKYMMLHFKVIINKYAARLQNSYMLSKIKPAGLLDHDFEQKIMENVNLNAHPQDVARHIYMNLCQLVQFDINFFVYGCTLDNDINKQIWNKDISQVNLKDNRVVCNNFCQIYASLLNKIGIETRVLGDFHKYNLVKAGADLFIADATTKIWDNQVAIYDIARVQMGLGTSGFTFYNKDKDMHKMTLQSNENIGYHQKNLEDLFEESKLQSFDPYIIKDICERSHMVSIELMTYIKFLLKRQFKKSIDIRFLAKKLDHLNFEACLLILYHQQFYLLSKDDMIKVTKDEIFDLASKDKIKVIKKKEK